MPFKDVVVVVFVVDLGVAVLVTCQRAKQNDQEGLSGARKFFDDGKKTRRPKRSAASE